jgi:EmrB/QacA subfamily drug resistance transporter
LVVVASVVGTFLTSLDVTVVGTAMPTIISQLGGIALYPWVFSIFLLTSTVSVPLYGKAADLFGRKPAYFTAVALFLAASLACALAKTMGELIFWRGVQGFGAGGVMPVTLTIVGDLYPSEERAKVQGFFSAVWAISSVLGPAVGAFIVARWSWSWVFLINLPFGLVAAAILSVALREEVPRRAAKLDLLGAILLSLSSTALMWALLRGGRIGFGDLAVIGALAFVGLAGAAFVAQERRHPDPMISPELLKERVVQVSCGAGLFLGVVLYGITSYVPAFVQGALGGSPADAGTAVIPLGIAWPLSSMLSGRIMRRIGQRATVIVGSVLLAAGGAPFFWLDAHTTRGGIVAAILVLGCGMGLTTTTLLVSSQSAVDWKRRGSVTALVQFSRMIGGAIGVAAMGAVLNASLAPALAERPELLDVANMLMDPHKRATFPAESLALISGVLAEGLSRALIGVAIATSLTLLASAAFPRRPAR